MDKLKKVLSGQDTEDRGGLSEVVEATSLSSGTRIKGFIACFAAGILCSLLSYCCCPLLIDSHAHTLCWALRIQGQAGFGSCCDGAHWLARQTDI
uniref:SFT2 domain containing 2 n=1 Tax=Balaenoptera musculus TaxID=9771 RepID=A0A8C0CZF2_BALMU